MCVAEHTSMYLKKNNFFNLQDQNVPAIIPLEYRIQNKSEFCFKHLQTVNNHLQSVTKVLWTVVTLGV